MGTYWVQYKLFHYATFQCVLNRFNINCSLCNNSMGTYWVQYKLFFHYATFQWVLIGVNINCSFIMQQFDGYLLGSI